MATHTIYAYSEFFGVKYVGRKHAEHLYFSGIDLIWDYAQNHSGRTFRLLMKSYIAKLLFKVGHKLPAKKQLSPHLFREITYDIMVQKAPEKDSSRALYEKGVLQVQLIVVAPQYYARAVNIKLLVALSAIGSKQASKKRKCGNKSTSY